MGNLIIPLAGFGNRFVEAGFSQTKPLINAGPKKIIEWAYSSVSFSQSTNVVFVVRKDQCIINGIDGFLKNLHPTCKIVKLDKPTGGSLETALIAIKELALDGEIYIHTSDICLPIPFELENNFSNDIEAFTVTFKANSPSYSYCKLKKNTNLVEKMIEKEVISQIANVGIYGFKSAKKFISFAEKIIEENLQVRDEFYISSVFDFYLKDNLKIVSKFIEEVHIIGTPKELNFFLKFVARTMYPKKIGFVSDHSGFEFKTSLINLFKNNNYEVFDYGCFSILDCDYSDFVKTSCEGINSKEIDLVIGSCHSGQGVNICANHQPDIISVIPLNPESLSQARKHNCPNFITFASSIWTAENAFKAFKTDFYNIHFEGGRHSIRIQKVFT